MQISHILSIYANKFKFCPPPPAATDTAGWMGDAGDFGATAGGVQGIEIFLHFLAIKFAFLSLTY